MARKEFNSRRYGPELTSQLVYGGFVIVVLIGLGFVLLQMGQGAFFFALATFGAIGLAIVAIWLFLKLIEVLTRSDDK